MSGLDDIPYMQEHGQKEEYLLFVDSEKRDKQNFKTPSEYQVTFDVPFYNVYGVDVLDTSIPRTQYLVDSTKNILAFNVDNEGWCRFEVDPGDYNITQLMTTLELGLVNNNKPISISPLSTPGDVKGQLRFYSNYPFSLDMTASTIRNTIGFANPIIQSESTDLQYYDFPVGYTEGDDDIFIANVDHGNVQYVSAFQGPSPVLDSLPVTSDPTCQLFTAALTGNVTQVTACFTQVGSPVANTVHFDVLDASGTLYADGNFDVLVDSYDSPSICYNINQSRDLVINRPYYLSLTSDNDDAQNTWNVFHSQPSSPQQSVSGIFTGNVSNLIPYTSITQQLCCTVLQGGVQYRVIAPGLYNLTGERYILIKCKEIEDHLYNTQAFTNNYNMGLTKVQLGNFGYGENRYDFSGYISRTFHPISKLMRMTLRFEQSDGTLYDFKGVDHTITFKLRYYTSTQKSSDKYLINPKYNPNMREWEYAKSVADRNKRWESDRVPLLRKLN